MYFRVQKVFKNVLWHHMQEIAEKVSKFQKDFTGKGLKYWKEEKCRCLFTMKCVKKYKQGTYYEDMECET